MTTTPREHSDYQARLYIEPCCRRYCLALGTTQMPQRHRIVPIRKTLSSRVTLGYLGIFTIDPQQRRTIYIKAVITNSTSVLMAEAAAMALATPVTSALSIQNTIFLTNNQLLVSFFNGTDFSSPPIWDIKPFTQSFINTTNNNNSRVLKVARNQNVTAHTLATQAFQCTLNPSSTSISCTNTVHVTSCPLRVALNSIPWESSLIAASCC